MAINYPVVSEIADGVYRINEFGYSSIYVVVGSKRALVIDTGAGCFRLKAAIRRLTFLPYDVVLTHGHIAQAGGIGQFENIYAYPGEYARAMKVSRVDSIHFCASVQKDRAAGLWDDALPIDGLWDKIPSITELYEGFVFDLGNRCVKTVRTSGHTYGSCSFIDDRSRIAFAGDACGTNMDITECCVTSAIRGLYNLHAHGDEFDRIFPGNTGGASVTDVISISPEVLNDCIAVCRGILTDSVTIHQGKDFCTAEFHGVKVLFREDRLYEVNEEPLPI